MIENDDEMIQNELTKMRKQIKPSDELINKTITKERKIQEECYFKNKKLLLQYLVYLPL